MLKLIDSAGQPELTKLYADTCWRNQPRLSPDWWRELEGLTVGKLALDWREAVSEAHLLTQGFNLLLTSTQTHAEVERAILESKVNPQSFLRVLVCDQVPETAHSDFLIWQISSLVDQSTLEASLQRLEQGVRDGKWQGYGIYDPAMSLQETPRPLHMWLQLADQAATQIYGRRKRSSLSILLAEMDVLNLSWVTQANTVDGDEAVNPLELAARRYLAVVVVSPPVVQPPSPESLDSLMTVVQAEKDLNEALGGWPMVEGKPLFNLLTPLQQGATPWPTVAQWEGWRSQLWPLMRRWVASEPTAASYSKAMEELLPYGAELAAYAEQQLREKRLAQLAPHLPPDWQAWPAPLRNAGLLSSMAGVTAVGLSPHKNMQVINLFKDFSDLRFLFE